MNVNKGFGIVRMDMAGLYQRERKSFFYRIIAHSGPKPVGIYHRTLLQICFEDDTVGK